MSGEERWAFKLAVWLLPQEIRARKREEYLADIRDAHLGGVSENQIIIGALGASMRTRISVARRGLAATKLLDRKQFMKMTLASCGIAAVLGVAGIGAFIPAAPPQANVTHMTVEEMQENVGSTDVSTLIISDEPATATPITPVSKHFNNSPAYSSPHVVDIAEATINLTPEDQAKVLSGGPLRITVNSGTGLIESVSPLP